MTGPTLVQFTIYHRPDDAPDHWVVREWRIFRGNAEPGPARIVDSLEDARAIVPAGMICIPRAPDDDPKIVETWT
jgi:hypothetical protein